jgi:hypothetical protein
MLSTGGAICAEPRKQFLRQPGTLLDGIQDSVLLGNRLVQEILCPSAVKVIHEGNEVQLQSLKDPEPIRTHIEAGAQRRRYDSDRHRSWRFAMPQFLDH